MLKTYCYQASNNTILHDLDPRDSCKLAVGKNLLWIDLFNFTEAEINEVGRTFGFHPLTVEDCLTFSPRAKVDRYEGYYFFTLHAIRYEEDSDEEIALEQLNIYLGPNYVVTLHRRTLPPLGRIARDCLAQHLDVMRHGADHFLLAILDGLTDQYFPILERVDERIDEIEDRMYHYRNQEVTEEFMSLKRTILAMRRAVLPQKRMFAGVHGHRPFPVAEENTPFYLDLTDHIERITDSVDAFKDLVDGALATYNSLISARTTHTIRVLTVISTIFMPLTFLTGFFGMNVPLPGQHTIWSTAIITAGLLAVSIWMYAIFRLNKWI